MTQRFLPFMAALVTTAAAHAGDLKVEVSVPATRQGAVMVAVFSKAEGFPRGKPLHTAAATPVGGKASFRFDGLPNGDYALSVFLDENANFKIDSNVIGIPTELYGFSRNARGFAGPPPFADASFRVGDGTQQHSVELK